VAGEVFANDERQNTIKPRTLRKLTKAIHDLQNKRLTLNWLRLICCAMGFRSAQERRGAMRVVV
jgi:hypothetical protein